MYSNAERTKKIVFEFGCNIYDTGASEVQIALLTERIGHLQNHFIKNKKDYHSRRGLLKMVARRRRLLRYLKTHNILSYTKLIKNLGLRH